MGLGDLGRLRLPFHCTHIKSDWAELDFKLVHFVEPLPCWLRAGLTVVSRELRLTRTGPCIQLKYRRRGSPPRVSASHFETPTRNRVLIQSTVETWLGLPSSLGFQVHRQYDNQASFPLTCAVSHQSRVPQHMTFSSQFES